VLRTRVRIDPHHFEEPDPYSDPYRKAKSRDPDPRQSEKPKAVARLTMAPLRFSWMVPNGAVKASNGAKEPRMSSGAVEAHPGAVDGLWASVSDPHCFDKDPDPQKKGGWI
jgi:hypothetical protein